MVKARQYRFWIFLTLLAVASATVIYFIISRYDKESVSKHYYQPFETRAQNYASRPKASPQAGAVKRSNAPGMKESQIRKRKGDHYETY